MKTDNRKILSFFLWIVSLITMGIVIGFFTKPTLDHRAEGARKDSASCLPLVREVDKSNAAFSDSSLLEKEERGKAIHFFNLPSAPSSDWYYGLKKSSLTPPNFVFPVVWTFLYALLGLVGAFIWHSPQKLPLIKSLYLIQLLLNWCWSPCFFSYHLIRGSFFLLLLIDLLVGALLFLTFRKKSLIFFLMLPYFSWILFATYLNYYLWNYN